MKRLSVAVGLMSWLVVLLASAQTAPPSVAGKWTLTSDASSNGPSTLELKLDGQKISGTLAGSSGTFAVTGDYTDGKLTFSLDYNGQLTVTLTGKLQEDGSLAGTMEYGQGPVNWKAVRVKD